MEALAHSTFIHTIAHSEQLQMRSVGNRRSEMLPNNAVNRSGEVQRIQNGKSFVAARLRLAFCHLEDAT